MINRGPVVVGIALLVLLLGIVPVLFSGDPFPERGASGKNSSLLLGTPSFEGFTGSFPLGSSGEAALKCRRLSVECGRTPLGLRIGTVRHLVMDRPRLVYREKSCDVFRISSKSARIELPGKRGGFSTNVIISFFDRELDARADAASWDQPGRILKLKAPYKISTGEKTRKSNYGEYLIEL